MWRKQQGYFRCLFFYPPINFFNSWAHFCVHHLEDRSCLHSRHFRSGRKCFQIQPRPVVALRNHTAMYSSLMLSSGCFPNPVRVTSTRAHERFCVLHAPTRAMPLLDNFWYEWSPRWGTLFRHRVPDEISFIPWNDPPVPPCPPSPCSSTMSYSCNLSSHFYGFPQSVQMWTSQWASAFPQAQDSLAPHLKIFARILAKEACIIRLRTNNSIGKSGSWLRITQHFSSHSGIWWLDCISLPMCYFRCSPSDMLPLNSIQTLIPHQLSPPSFAKSPPHHSSSRSQPPLGDISQTHLCIHPL